MSDDRTWHPLQENEFIVSIKYFFVSKFTVETYCFADGRCLFKQPQSVIYLESV